MAKANPEEYHNFNLAIPKRLMPRLRAVAKRNHRSITQQIVHCIEWCIREEAEPVDEPIEHVR